MKAKIFSFVLFVAVVFVFSLVSAQVPNLINYQGKLTTPQGGLMDTVVSMQFSIYADSTTPTYLWQETQDSVAVNKSVFNVILGSVTSIPDNVFDGSIRYLGIKVGEDSEMSPRKPIVSVGYAYKSLEADTADYARFGPGVADNDWTFRITDGADTTLMTGGLWGIARYGNVLYGNADSTHVNLGVACTTGTSWENYKYCTVGGGYKNTASRNSATVGGGYYNTASRQWATVGGGAFNIASEYYATVGGGEHNTASDDFATVGGGDHNTASGVLAIVPGGHANTAAGYCSFAAGREVNLTEDADHTFAFGYNFTTSTDSAVVFYIAGNEMKVGIQTTSPSNILTVQQNSATDPIADAWTTYSSREYKRDIHELTSEEYQEALQKVVSVPVVRFHYKGEDTKEKIGVIAEDAPEEILAEGDNKAISLNEYISLLHAALKAQQQELDDLKTKLEKLESNR